MKISRNLTESHNGKNSPTPSNETRCARQQDAKTKNLISAKAPQNTLSIDSVIAPTPLNPLLKNLVQRLPRAGDYCETSGIPIESVFNILWDKKLGEGSFGVVYEATSKVDPTQRFAVKIPKAWGIGFEYDSTGLDKHVRAGLCELRLLKRIRRESPSSHLLKLVGVYDNMHEILADTASKYKLYIVTELLAAGDLFKYVESLYKKQPTSYSEGRAMYLFRQLARGIKALHDADIIHRDLKPHNIFIRYRRSPKDTASRVQALLRGEYDEEVVIGDFGLAVTTKHDLTKFAGSPGYAAPEMFCHPAQCSKKVDIWSAGVILTILLTGRPPEWFQNGRWSMYQKLSKWDPEKMVNDPNRPEWLWVSSAAKSLVCGMLRAKPEERFSIDDVLHSIAVRSADPSRPEYEPVISTDTVNNAIQRLSEFNARRKLRAATAAVAWSRRLSAIRAASLKKLTGPYTLAPHTLRCLEALFRRVSHGMSVSDALKQSPPSSPVPCASSGTSLIASNGHPSFFSASSTSSQSEMGYTSRARRYIDESQFCEAMQALGLFSNLDLKEVFRVFDGDGNGLLDYTEFVMGLTKLSSDAEDNLQTCFRIFDVDGNGFLDQKEILQFLAAIPDSVVLKQQEERTSKLSNQCDPGDTLDQRLGDNSNSSTERAVAVQKNHAELHNDSESLSLSLSRTEYENERFAVQKESDRLAELLEQFDADNDGRISYSEFVRGVDTMNLRPYLFGNIERATQKLDSTEPETFQRSYAVDHGAWGSALSFSLNTASGHKRRAPNHSAISDFPSDRMNTSYQSPSNCSTKRRS